MGAGHAVAAKGGHDGFGGSHEAWLRRYLALFRSPPHAKLAANCTAAWLLRTAGHPAALVQRRQEVGTILLAEVDVNAHLVRTRAASSVSQKSRTCGLNDASSPSVAWSVGGKADGGVMSGRV